MLYFLCGDYMKGKVIRNIILLLLIPVLITVGIIVYNNSNNNRYSSSVNYEQTETVQEEIKEYDEFDTDDKDFIYSISYNYPFMMFTAVGLVIIFSIFYFFLTRKKQW